MAPADIAADLDGVLSDLGVTGPVILVLSARSGRPLADLETAGVSEAD